MNYIQIEIDGVKRGFKFGVWVLGELIKKEGLQIQSLHDSIESNPIEFYVNVMYYGALWNCSRSKTEPDFDKEDVFEWVDLLGGLGSEELLKIQEVFSQSVSGDVPKKKAVKAKAKAN